MNPELLKFYEKQHGLIKSQNTRIAQLIKERNDNIGIRDYLLEFRTNINAAIKNYIAYDNKSNSVWIIKTQSNVNDNYTLFVKFVKMFPKYSHYHLYCYEHYDINLSKRMSGIIISSEPNLRY